MADSEAAAGRTQQDRCIYMPAARVKEGDILYIHSLQTVGSNHKPVAAEHTYWAWPEETDVGLSP